MFQNYIGKIYKSNVGLVPIKKRRKRIIESAMRVVVKPEPAAKTWKLPCCSFEIYFLLAKKSIIVNKHLLSF